jgi:teichuronic acid biosynthesis glycosyltransferase TuaC
MEVAQIRDSRAALATFECLSANASVLHVTNAWPHAGDSHYGVFVARQVQSLRSVGLTGDVLFVRGYLSPVAYLAAARLLASLSREEPSRYRLVHAHGGEAVLPARAFRGPPVVASYLGSDLIGRRGRSGRVGGLQLLRTLALRQLSRAATRTITVSDELARLLPPRMRARNTVIPDGVDLSLFDPADQHDARARLGWPDEQPVVLFAASPDVAVKRFWLAKQACDLARASIPDLVLRVADGVPPEEIPTLMSAADCLIVTSVSEGSSNVVKEALACNLPVVATDAGDIRELLAGVVPSHVCDDAPSLARAVGDCIVPRRRSNGRSHSDRFDAHLIAHRIRSVYEQALAQ